MPKNVASVTRSGDKDMERALELALDDRLADRVHDRQQPRRPARSSTATLERARRAATPRRFVSLSASETARACGSSAQIACSSTSCGATGTAALAEADAFIAECEAGSPHTQEGIVRNARRDIRLARGTPTVPSRPPSSRSRRRARPRTVPSSSARSLGRAAHYAERGELDEAHHIASRSSTGTSEHGLARRDRRAGALADQLGVGDDSGRSSRLSPFRRRRGPAGSSPWTATSAGRLTSSRRWETPLEAKLAAPSGRRMLASTVSRQTTRSSARLRSIAPSERRTSSAAARRCSPSRPRATPRSRARSGRSCRRCSRRSRRRRRRARRGLRRSCGRPRALAHAREPPAGRGRRART